MASVETCPHRPRCPGCPRFGEPGIAASARAALGALAARAGLPEPVLHVLPARGHRHRARLAVRGTASDPKLGLFEAGSHRIVAIPGCAVHHPQIEATADCLRDAIRTAGTAPYDDAHHRGALRYVQIVVERGSERVQVVLVGNGLSPSCLGALPEALAERLGDRLQGLFFNAQPQRTNTILSPRMERLAGEPAVCERIGGVDVFFPPDAFGQNHLPLFDRAVERIHALVPSGVRVAELYCGVGAIGLGLLERVGHIAFNERAAGGLAGLALGLAARPASERARASVVAGAAGEAGSLVREAEVVIVDPPRRGLDPDLVEALADAPPRRLLYLACDPTSLARDLEALTSRERLALTGLELFDFFPFTEHVEALAWLDRRG